MTWEAKAVADHDIVIPMMGMVQSLNVSVAAALVLYEAQRQRTIAGMYNTQQLPEEECQALAFQNGYPRLYKLCQRKGLPLPAINAIGEVDADDSWWKEMQITKAEANALEAD